ncbi:MAG TPA: SusC/RagA family TonB-linked outer membrane protein [Chitinophagaceae bacterium]|nr:SusC/RagA family TonB-linked outer membrane protein [Chitinophagaceae bacterium]
MRKLLSLFSALVLCTMFVYAQTGRTVSGTVTDDNGTAIPFATVKVQGSPRLGTSADQDGKFTLRNVPADAVLVISAQGHGEKTVTLGAENTVSVTLERTTTTLNEVVVTGAFNIKRSQRAVAYNAQNVNSEQLNTIRQTNLNSALAGKVAGLQVLDQSKVKLGEAGNVRLGGAASLGGGGVIYVVDGTIVNPNDINPDDIEDVTVYSGVNATALFGERAIGGAIVINSKKARKGRKGIGIEVNQGITFDRIYVLPKYQNEYAGGASYDMYRYTWQPGHPEEWKTLDGKYYHDYSDDASWGPRMVGQEYIPWYAWYPGTKYTGKTASLTPHPDNIRDFYQTGLTNNNNVSFSKAAEDYNVRVSYTDQYIKGLLYKSQLRKNIFNVNSSLDMGKYFTLNANVNYVASRREGEFNDGYSNQSTGSFSQWFHRDLDMKIVKELKDLRSPTGILASWNHNNPGTYNPDNPVAFYGGNYWYNFYTYFDNVTNFDIRERLYGDIGLTFKLNNNFRIRGTYRQNAVTTNYENKTSSDLEMSATQSGIDAFYGTGETYFKEQNFELVASYNTKFLKDFSTNVNVGGNAMRSDSRTLQAQTVNGFSVPNLYALTNSKDPIAYANARQKQQINSVFARGDVGFKNFLFAEFSLRNDWHSTLPEFDPDIFYKSFGVSFVFSELLSGSLPALSFGKLRASWGETPRSLGIYDNNFLYGVNANQYNGNFLMTTPDVVPDPSLVGAVVATWEVGMDLKFLRNRAGLSVTFQNTESKNIPIGVDVSGTSGFTRKTINAGRIDVQTVLLQLNGKPVQSKNFTWDVVANFSKQVENKIVELAPGVDQIVQFSGAFSGTSSAYVVHRVGEEWGQLRGGGIKKINGLPVLDNSGRYIKEDNVLFGSVLPDYIGGFLNTFSYKNFVANINIDFQSGGKYFSLSDFWGTFSGLTERTVALNDKGNPIRDRVADGGGVHVVGVDADGKPVDYYVDAQSYFHQFRERSISENSVYDMTFVKLREVSLGYRIPVGKIGNISRWLQNATFSVVARNPWLIYAQNRDFDPSELAQQFGEDGQFPGSRSLGFNLRLGF